MAIPPGLLVDNASVVLFLALAVFVARVTPASPASRAFVTYVVALAAGILSINAFWMLTDTPLALPLAYVSAALWFAGSLAVARLAHAFPAPLAPHERARLKRSWRIAALLCGVLLVANVVWVARDPAAVAAESGLSGDLQGPYLILVVSSLAFAMVSLYLGILLSLRFAAAAPEDDAMRGQSALAASALLIYPLLIHSAVSLGADDALRRALTAAWVGLVALAWLRATHLAPRGARLARNVAWLALVASLVGLTAGLAWGPVAAINSGMMGLGRTLGVLLLAYAIVRYHLLDIDVKIRWTISRGTVAATFVAVFFVVSEGAQELFAGSTGSSYLGIVAAGALVFAIAPLQRVAERLAEKAVPPAEPRARRKEEAYRAMLRKFLADGSVTHEEERALATLASELGIDAARAFELRDEVARQQVAAA